MVCTIGLSARADGVNMVTTHSTLATQATPSTAARQTRRDGISSTITPMGTVGSVDGDVGRDRGYRPVQRWLAAAVHVHSSTAVPLAVALPLTSRHSPDWALLMVPFELRFHR